MQILSTNTTKTFSKKHFALAGIAAAIALAGCSSDNPDEGSTPATTAISGLAVDGYIAGATVYVDYNNDGRRNAGEPFATTDKDGYFSTAKDLTDYCASDASDLEKIHCLKVSQVGNSFVLRTFGGFDLYTGEPFIGSLSRRVTVGEDGVVGNQVLSPLSSLLVDVPGERDPIELLNVFGLAEADLDADFLSESGFTALRVNTAIKLHKIVTLFAEVLEDQYEAIGEERGFPESADAFIYEAFAKHVQSNVLDADTLTAVFNEAQAAIRALYEADEELSVPASINGNAVVMDALDLQIVVDNAIPPGATAFADVQTRAIGVEAIVYKMLDEAPDVAAAVAEASNPNSGLYTAIANALGTQGGDVDFIALTEVNFAAPDYSEVAVVGGGTFADLIDKQLFISLDDGEASGSGYLFFNSEQGASVGELKLCLEYDDGEPGDPAFEETDGVLLSGSWLALSDSKLILNLAGSLTIAIADRGQTDDSLHRYSLSYGGDTRSWLSEDGLLDELASEDVVEQPADDASCEALLNPPEA